MRLRLTKADLKTDVTRRSPDAKGEVTDEKTPAVMSWKLLIGCRLSSLIVEVGYCCEG